MISSLASQITTCSIRNNVVLQEEREIYEYGIVSLITKGMYNLAVLMLGLALGCLLEIVVFQGAYSLIRKVAGGHHSKSRHACFIISCLVVLVAVMPTKLFNEEVLLQATKILLVASIAIIGLLAPCDSENKKINMMERKIYRRRSLLVMGGLELMSIIFFTHGMVIIGYIIAASLGAESLGLVVGIKGNNAKK